MLLLFSVRMDAGTKEANRPVISSLSSSPLANFLCLCFSPCACASFCSLPQGLSPESAPEVLSAIEAERKALLQVLSSYAGERTRVRREGEGWRRVARVKRECDG